MTTPAQTQDQITQAASRSARRPSRTSTTGAPSPVLDSAAFPIFLSIASAADIFLPWGYNVRARDTQLRAFWPTEDVLAGAIYTICGRNAAFNFSLRGPRSVTSRILAMLHQANFGEGWIDFIMKVACDFYTTDNGAFIEVIRATGEPDSEVIGIAHLDSWRCRRTGDWRAPVVYTDLDGRDHLLLNHQVITMTEFPSPIESARGIQVCALSRVLRAAQLARTIATYQQEKISGRNPKDIYIVSGVTQMNIENKMRLDQAREMSQGNTAYTPPTIIAQPDPTARVSVEHISLASLPDNWDAQVWFNQYIAKLALGTGSDYQDLAPLPGGNLGTSAQSQILHLKSRGKGPALFMKSLEHKFNFHGVLTPDAKFEYEPHDVESSKMEAELRGMQARAIAALVKALDLPNTGAGAGGVGAEGGTGGNGKPSPQPDSKATTASTLTPAERDAWMMRVREVAVQVLNDLGWFPAEYMEHLGIPDVSPSRVVTDSGEGGQAGAKDADSDPNPYITALLLDIKAAAMSPRERIVVRDPLTNRITGVRDITVE